MLLAKVFAERNVWPATGQHGGQRRHKGFNLDAKELPANPGYEIYDSVRECGLPSCLS
jgi:hypothetical protein